MDGWLAEKRMPDMETREQGVPGCLVAVLN